MKLILDLAKLAKFQYRKFANVGQILYVIPLGPQVMLFIYLFLPKMLQVLVSNPFNYDFFLPSAVRADRMRGGRNKFGPLYRHDRQMKQQKANTDPYRIKMETRQTPGPQSPNDHQTSGPTSNTSSSAAFHLSHIMYPSGMERSCQPMPLDCTMNNHRGLSPPSMPFRGLCCSFPEYSQDKGEPSFSYNPVPTHFSVHTFTPTRTPTSSPCSTPSSAPAISQAGTQTTPPPTTPSPNFLIQLLEGEQDEGQLCTKVLASLQREQANRGKHDCLNTFSIMCKIADQTLFGLVEWARNSNLFKELKVRKFCYTTSQQQDKIYAVSRVQGF